MRQPVTVRQGMDGKLTRYQCNTFELRYVRGALDTRDPLFGHSAIQFEIKSLLERAEEPR